jgi:hypothetical protein
LSGESLTETVSDEKPLVGKVGSKKEKLKSASADCGMRKAEKLIRKPGIEELELRSQSTPRPV